MQLFDNIQRDYYGPELRMEGYYDYLNRSARPESIKMRELLEQWFSAYPEEEQFELRRRFEQNYESAFFELFLHALLAELGCEVIIHPSKEGANGKKPDFLVKPTDGNDFYLEAVVVSEGSEEQQKAQKRSDFVFDGINRIDISGYQFWIEESGTLRTQPSKNDIERFIKEQLAKNTRSQILDGYDSGDYTRLIYWEYPYEDWTLKIFPVPINPEEPIQQSVGGHVTSLGEFVNLKKGIRKKALKYGDFNIPYVIAANAINGSISDNEVVETLYGSIECRLHRTKSGLPLAPEMIRIPDGVWINPAGPVNTRVSAILLAKDLRTDNIPRADIKLYLNPWAKNVYSSVLNKFPRMILENGYINEKPGKSLTDIFGIPISWPED